MPNPQNAYDEWIEIYNSGNELLNLSEWSINVSATSNISTRISCNNIQNCSLITNSTYLIVIGKKADISAITNQSIFYFNASNISNYWFTNTGANISLYNKTALVSSINYPDYSSDSKRGKSYAFQNNNWIECSNSTPGVANNCDQGQINQSNQTNQSQWNISASFPQQAYNNGTEFNVSINFNNFENYVYDLKIEIKNSTSSTSNIGEIFNPFSQEWQSTYNYIKEAFAISSSNLNYNAKLRINPDKNYIGQAFLQIKLQETNASTLYSSQVYNIEILNGTIANNSETEPESTKKMEYNFVFPEIINSGENFTIEIEAINNQNHSQTIEIWSYVYSGSKCYSCQENESRESNKQEIKIDSDESEKVTLQNSIDNDAENGTYKLKVKILKKGLNTAKEFTFDIDVINTNTREENKSSEGIEKESILNQQSFGNTEKTSGIYESKAERNKKIAFYFLTISLLMVIIWLGKKK